MRKAKHLLPHLMICLELALGQQAKFLLFKITYIPCKTNKVGHLFLGIQVN